MKTPEARLNTAEMLDCHDMVVRLHSLFVYVDGAASLNLICWI
jgi:hypothetical protein